MSSSWDCSLEGTTIRMSPHLLEPVRAVVLTAGRPRIGRGAQRGQCAHRRTVREQAEDLVEPRQIRAGDVARELGVGDAGMGGDRDGRGALGCQPALQVVGEHQIGQLGLAVGGDAVIAAFPLQIVEVDGGQDPVGPAGDDHHTGALHGQQVLQQQPRQREVAEVVGAELQLEAVLGGLPR